VCNIFRFFLGIVLVSGGALSFLCFCYASVPTDKLYEYLIIISILFDNKFVVSYLLNSWSSSDVTC
jgi:hypothetical protein